MSLPKLSPPPRIKVLEAMGALADGRIEVLQGNFFRVISSDGSRVYNVYVEEFSRGMFRACSTDNGTVYRGYVGYPIISAMMLLGYLRRDEDVERALSGIPWRKLNEELKKYALVESEVMRSVSFKGVSQARIRTFVDVVMEKLRSLTILHDTSLCGASGEEEESPS